MTTDLLAEIRSFLTETGLAPSRFGRLAANDPHLVSDLESGRSPTFRKAEAIRRFMSGYQGSRFDRVAEIAA
ncbi:hypothetical protein [Azospirillum sp. TSH64]|uniref:hypothetical protein n=1 Tax=Azospirillum sp. TSH64 TaxID=652740 RepID=UPI000D60F5F8|nr:hypothetical protein [Azospirillum sp. TSH64]PWC81278.1 hypothetical protein TSH64_01165 [Azospirillum sp. TSH64]